MTKLMEWVFCATIFLSIWTSIVTKQIKNEFLEEHMTVVVYSPVILVILFGLYAASVVLWRVYSFNNCEAAAAELQKQIVEAREDLKKKGFKFESAKS